MAHMNKEKLQDLVKVLNDNDYQYAIFDWNAADDEVVEFQAKIAPKFVAELLDSTAISLDHEDAIIELLRELYPNFDFDIGSYGEVYVYPSGEVQVMLHRRVITTEFEKASINLSSTHSSVG